MGLVLVSAANDKYFRCLYQLLQSIRARKLHRVHRVFVYDLGLSQAHRHMLEEQYGKDGVILRTFEFSKYPPFVRCDNSVRGMQKSEEAYHSSGYYAWKPIVIQEVCEEVQGNVLWLDSSTIVLGDLHRIVEQLDTQGTFVPYCGRGTVGDWTDARTSAYLGASPAVLNARVRASTVCGFNYSLPIVRTLVNQWKEAALTRECIAPEGHAVTHRHDSSILKILAYQFREQYGLVLTEDALDLCAANPIRCLTIRQKVTNGVPLFVDPIVRLYFRFESRFEAWRLRQEERHHTGRP